LYEGTVLSVREKNIFGNTVSIATVSIEKLAFITKVDLTKSICLGASITLQLQEASSFFLKFTQV